MLPFTKVSPVYKFPIDLSITCLYCKPPSRYLHSQRTYLPRVSTSLPIPNTSNYVYWTCRWFSLFPSKPLSRFAAHVEPGHRGLLLRYLISYVKPVVKLFLFYSGGLRFELHVRAFKFSEKNYFSLRGMINSLRPTPTKFTKKNHKKRWNVFQKLLLQTLGTGTV